MSRSARGAAGLVSFAAFASVGIDFAIQMKESGAAEALWSMARYFTFLTNTTVALGFGAAASRGNWSSANFPAALTVWIVVTGVVYHALLAQTHDPQGIRALSNFGLHTVVPLGCLAVWVFWIPKSGLTYFGPLIWTTWPLIYAIYALLRGLVDGEYPYFFLNPVNIGIPAVIAYIIGLGLLFTFSGTVLVMLARFLGEK